MYRFTIAKWSIFLSVWLSAVCDNAVVISMLEVHLYSFELF